MMVSSDKLRPILLPALLAAALSAPLQGRAQQTGRIPGGRGAAVESSAPVENLLSRARQGAARRDWKFAIDSAQRVIDRPEGALIEETPGRYVSARRAAERFLASLGPDARSAYRVLFDGKANGLVQRAVRDHDQIALREVADRYLLTSAGDDAAALLASWLLDAGHGAEALDLLNRVVELCPDHDVPAAAMARRRIAALSMLGESSEARRVLEGTTALADADRARLDRFISDVDASAVGNRTAGVERYTDHWPTRGGTADRRNLMPPVEPTLAGNLQWRQRLPGGEPAEWETYLAGEEAGIPPVAGAIAANGRLFVKGVGPCAAIDLDTFAPLWTGRGEVEGIAERYLRRRREMTGFGGDALPDLSRQERLAFDHIGAALCVAGDLVLSIERGGSGRSLDADGLVVQQTPSVRRSMTGTRLVALDAATGRLRWQQGRTTDPDDPLAAVAFLSTPLALGEELWVPARVRGDICLLVLERANGDLVRQITLCTAPATPESPVGVLCPTAGGGLIYQPTGQGLLFAVGRADRQVRWAVRYERRPVPKWRRSSLQADTWLSTPPIVSGPMVLLAPADGDALLAFDSTTGQLRWSAPRGDNRYVAGADGQNVWLAGNRVMSLSLLTGEERWVSDAFDTTGRAVVAGEAVLVPTLTGLVRLQADSGATVGATKLPTGEAPLGNLLVLADSLVSVDPSEVRRYPDVERSYARTVAAHQADPAEPGAAIRLAGLEMLAGAADRALAALQQVGELGDANTGGHGQLIAHLRVEALITLAEQSANSREQALAYLQRAADEAVADSDVLRATLRLTERLRQMDQAAEAYGHLWPLGLCQPSALMLESADGAMRSARAMIAEQLRALEGEVDAATLEDVSQQASRAVTEAARELPASPWTTPAVRTLRSLADMGGPAGWDQKALIELADWAASNGRYEPAEQDYLAAIRLARQPEFTARALAGLATMYLRPDQQLVAAATRHLDRLETEFGAILFDWPASNGQMAHAAGSEVAKQLGRDVDQAILAKRRAAGSKRTFRITGQEAWSVKLPDNDTHLLPAAGTDREALSDRVLTLTEPDVLRAHRLVDGSTEWEAQLRFPDEVLSYGMLDAPMFGEGIPARRVVCAGQSGLIRTATGLHAIGLVTGKRLWAVPQKPPGERIALDALVDAGDGRVACVPETGTVAVLDLRDGSTRWRRQLTLKNVGRVRVVDDLLVVNDIEATEARVLELAGGRVVQSLRFDAASLAGRRIEPICANGLLCGADGASVTAYDLHSGERRWQVEVPEELLSIFRADTARLGVGTLGGKLRLIDVATGVVVLEDQLVECRNGILDGRVISGILVVGGAVDSSAGRRPAMVGIDVDSGAVRWHRDDLALVSRAPWLFDGAGGVVPTMINVKESSAGRRSSSPEAALAAIDPRSGRDLGQIIRPDPASAGEQITGEIGTRPGLLLVQTSERIRAVVTMPAKAEVSQ